jgi:carboxymethylenebutenolidase
MTSLPITETLAGDFACPESGSGPGLLLLADPALARDWAEEGYVTLAVAAPDLLAVEAALAALRARPELNGGIGMLGAGEGAALACAAAATLDLAATSCHVEAVPPGLLDAAARSRCPLLLHVAGQDAAVTRAGVAIHTYAAFDKPARRLAHSRDLALFRRVLGPAYDLIALWEEHTRQEFGERDVDATMRTMVAAPYVNHIPTMTGGVGHDELARFYRHHFIPRTPEDTRLVPVARTVGVDRVVDEMLFCFTHDIEMDWMLPGVAPTGRYVEVPLVAIINFRGPKLYHEHIYWDQASVLVQIGLLDPAGLPVAGAETARKLLDETLPSNRLMARWADSAS